MAKGKPCVKCGSIERYENGRCKACKRECNRRYYETNAEEAKERSRQWYAANPEKAHDANRQWRNMNPDMVREYGRRQYATNTDKVKDRNRQWQKSNRKKVNGYKRMWYEANQGRERERIRRWDVSNPEVRRAIKQNYRARKSQAGGSFTAAEWKALVAQYDGHCCFPGCERTDLHADHVIPVALGGSSDISNIQPLCQHHNLSKGANTNDYRYKGGFVRWIQKRLL
jgi:hypothetical protein